MAIEGVQERLRRGEEALLEQLEHELGSESLGVVAVSVGADPGVLGQQGVDALLFGGVFHRDVFERAPRELVGAVPVLDFALEAADHDGAELGGLGGDAARETLVVEQFQEGGKALFVAIVRCGGEEELVLEVLADFAEGLGALRVEGEVAGAAGGGVVGFVDDEDVEVAQAGARAIVGYGLPEHAQGVLALQVIHGGDEAREMGPGVGVEAALAAEALDEGTVDDDEIEPELFQHLVAPLDLQGGRADHQDAVRAMAEHQFEDDHAGLDGFAEAHVVGDEQVDARHLDGADHRVELVAFDFDAAAKGRLKLARVSDGCGAPADGIEEGLEVGWLVEALRLGQFHLLEGARAGFDLPDHLQLFAQGIVLDGGEANQVLGRLADLQAVYAAANIGHDVASLANDRELTLFRYGAKGLH